MNKNNSNIGNFIFSSLVVLNAFIFLFVLPAFIYRHNTRPFTNNEYYRYGVALIIFIIFMIVSFHAFYRGIDLEDMEGRRTRYGVLSGGDKEIFAFLSKPIAFGIQIISVLVQILILVELYK